MTHYQEIVRRVAESIKEESFSFLSSLVPIPSEDEMVAVVYSRWGKDNRYGKGIVNYPNRPPLKDSVSSIILNLKLLFPKIEDFRRAKEILSLYEHNRLETAYLQVSLGRFAGDVWLIINEEKEASYQAYLCSQGFDNVDEYHEANGWIRQKDGQLVKPKKEVETELPNVLQQFHIERYHKDKRVGHRGKNPEVIKES